MNISAVFASSVVPVLSAKYSASYHCHPKQDICRLVTISSRKSVKILYLTCCIGENCNAKATWLHLPIIIRQPSHAQLNAWCRDFRAEAGVFKTDCYGISMYNSLSAILAGKIYIMPVLCDVKPLITNNNNNILLLSFIVTCMHCYKSDYIT